jgi:pyruvate dehydrogenase E1 component beta subunit
LGSFDRATRLSPTLEDLYIPSAAHIVEAVRKTMNKGGSH